MMMIAMKVGLKIKRKRLNSHNHPTAETQTKKEVRRPTLVSNLSIQISKQMMMMMMMRRRRTRETATDDEGLE